jgi:hypothetical protein
VQALDPAHYNFRADWDGCRGNRVPDFAVNEDLALGNQRALRDADLADQALHAGDNFIATGAEGNHHQIRRDQAEGNADGHCRQQVHSHFRDRRVHQ